MCLNNGKRLNDDTLMISSHNELSRVEFEKGNKMKALEICSNNVKRSLNRFGEDDVITLKCQSMLAWLLKENRYFEESKLSYEKLLIKLKDKCDMKIELSMNIYKNYANVLQLNKEYKNAGKYYHEALELKMEIYGHQHINITEDILNLANYYKIIKNTSEADTYYKLLNIKS